MLIIHVQNLLYGRRVIYVYRALGVLTSRFMPAGGMSYSVYTELYNRNLLEPISLFYCSAIWGQVEHRAINNLQNRALRHKEYVEKRGDMGMDVDHVFLNRG